MRSIGLFVLAVATSVAACSDPVFDGQVNALGEEDPNVPQGPYHRAGQPCEVCHSASGPASSAPFSVAGTIFAKQTDPTGVDGVTIAMTDTTGSSYSVTTNCVGNFFVRRTEWDPAFPILVRVWKGDKSRTMQGQVGRERSCANCHKDPFTNYEKLSSVGHVYLYSASDSAPAPAANCPTNPTVGGAK